MSAAAPKYKSLQEDLLKEWLMLDPQGKPTKFTKLSVREELLIKHNIYPIATFKDQGFTSFVGGGTFNSVYEVLYNGKRMVAKITKHDNDAQITKRLSDLKKNIPYSKSKHIMRVYDLIKDDVFGCNILLAEYLNPLPDSLSSELWLGDRSYSKITKDYKFRYRLDALLSNQKKLEKLIDHTILVVAKLDADEVDTLRKNIFDSGFISLVTKHQNKDKHILLQIDKYALEISKNITFVSGCDIESILFKTYTNIYNYLGGVYFPEYHIQDDFMARNVEDPRVRQFVKFLNWLRGQGILWADVSKHNVMVRGNSGDLVLCDPGLFTIVDKPILQLA